MVGVPELITARFDGGDNARTAHSKSPPDVLSINFSRLSSGDTI